MNTFIAGMAIAEVGAGINELTTLAVMAELAPTKKRGMQVVCLSESLQGMC
jgi:hypothetical protein